MANISEVGQKKVKVVQCWDDGVSDDIRVMDILRKYGAKASFNLNAGTHKEVRESGWRYKDLKDVYKLSRPELVSAYDGFLVANHSLTHPSLENIPIADAVREIVEGRDQLEQIFGYAVLGFAYPFGGHNSAVHEAIRDAGHVYARTVENVAEAYPPLDAMAFHPNCHYNNPAFFSIFERAKACGVFYFWGHSYEIITEDDWQEFDDKIARLSADPTVEWTNLPDLFT